ncbi:MAG: ferritin-like domain-containing protein [Armatimonadota bacterium]
MNDFDALLRSEVNRRAFLTRMSAAGLGAAAVALLAGCGGGSSTAITPGAPTPTPGTGFFDPTNFPGIPGRNADEVVLNFALTLEILEADLYRQALNLASGRALSAPLDANAPPSGSLGGYSQTVGNGTIAGNLAGPAFLYLVQYAYVEAAHRDFLRTALSSLGAPVATPNALGYTTTLTSGASLSDILGVLLIAEEEGTRAYHGAAPFMNNPALLTTAVAIYSTECRHSAAINYVLGKNIGPAFLSGDKNITGAVGVNPAPFSNNTFEYLRDPVQVLNDVQPFFIKAN